jgi:methylated-DNA-[protein]-cysteine S-methyltransferase
MLFNYHLIEGSPAGDLGIVYQPTPFLILRILLPKLVSGKWKQAPEESSCKKSTCTEITRISKSLLDYLNGEPNAPGPVPWRLLDLSHLSPLQKKVLVATCDIPYGRTVSYKTIAAAVDRPKAYRFVGTTLAINPFPILIPCHRVIRSDGAIGEYGGGSALKKWLIDLESHPNM